MEKLISEIEAYAKATGVHPATVLRRSAGYGWGVWHKWTGRKSSPTMESVEKVRTYMAAHPPKDLDQMKRAEVPDQ